MAISKRILMSLFHFVAAMLLWLPSISQADELSACFHNAADRYHVDVSLLHAIAEVESNMNPAAINRSNGDGSQDLGLMQINSLWLPELSRYGITRSLLLENACINVQVGAWILATNFSRMGLSWSAVGAYNAGMAGSIRAEQNRRRYITRIRKALSQQKLTNRIAEK